jgi:hypothetical protein
MTTGGEVADPNANEGRGGIAGSEYGGAEDMGTTQAGDKPGERESIGAEYDRGPRTDNPETIAQVRAWYQESAFGIFAGLGKALLSAVSAVGNLMAGNIVGAGMSVANIGRAIANSVKAGKKVDEAVKEALTTAGYPDYAADQIMGYARDDIAAATREMDTLDKGIRDAGLTPDRAWGDTDTNTKGVQPGGGTPGGGDQAPKDSSVMSGQIWDEFTEWFFGGEAGPGLQEALQQRHEFLSGQSEQFTGQYVSDLGQIEKNIGNILGTLQPSQYPSIPMGDANLPWVPKFAQRNAQTALSAQNQYLTLADKEFAAQMEHAQKYYPNAPYFEYGQILGPLAQWEQEMAQKERLNTVEMPDQSMWEKLSPYAQPAADTIGELLKMWMDGGGDTGGGSYQYEPQFEMPEVALPGYSDQPGQYEFEVEDPYQQFEFDTNWEFTL